MKGTLQLVGLAVALLLTIGCEGAPSQNVEARSILDNHDIVMGKDANIEDIPYQISIQFLRIHKCGGAIISENWVITAAHCIDPRVSGQTWFKRIQAGSTTSIPVVGSDGEIYQIDDLTYHPRWDLTALDYDVGVVRVSNKFVYSDRIQAIGLSNLGDNIADYIGIGHMAGWGVSQTGGPFTGWRLKVADIPLMPRDSCNELLKDAPAGTTKITSRMLCGAGIGNAGPCHGDSGGPLLFGGSVIGLVSWTVAGCNANYPTVFTNVMNAEIKNFVRETSGILN